MAKNEVAAPNSTALPTFLQQSTKTASLGNIDKSDLIIPRVKLIQATSPEIDDFDVKRGQFFHTLGEVSMGDKLVGIPIYFRKSIVLWAPRDDAAGRGILARSSDCVRWDEGFANQQFTVRPKGAVADIVWDTKGSVAESGLDQFGSSIPGDSDSKPAASLTYNMLWYFPEFPDFSPAVMINTRSAVKPAKNLISKLEMSPHDHFAHVIEIGVKKENGDEGDYFNYSYRAAGFVQSEDLYNKIKGLYETFSTEDWRPSDEAEEADKDASVDKASSKPAPAGSSKF